MQFDGATGVFSGTPANGDVGSLSVKVTATDSANASATKDLDISVANTNDAPTATAGVEHADALEDAAFSYTLPAATFADVDLGDSLTYSATMADGSALPSWLQFDSATGAFSGTPANGDVGSLSVKVTATDSAFASVTKDLDIGVVNTNDAPTATAGSEHADAVEDAAFSYMLPADTFADVDLGDSLTYSATMADGAALPSWLHFDPASGTFSGTPANGDVGSLSVKVTATDSAHASASKDLDISVANTNDAPTATAGHANASATEDASFSYALPADTFADVDLGDSLSYSATMADGSALPSWLQFDTATGAFSGTPANADVGSLSRPCDGDGRCARERDQSTRHQHREYQRCTDGGASHRRSSCDRRCPVQLRIARQRVCRRRSRRFDDAERDVGKRRGAALLAQLQCSHGCVLRYAGQQRCRVRSASG